jgi:tRNA A-37 threonylcarbamoyl transferase component Bud32
MGEVFSAQVVTDDPYNVNIRRGMRVAVKVVNRMVVDDLLMARLEREAQAARLIHSAYVPALLAVDRTPDESKEGQEELFLVLQLLEGQSFSHRLKARGGFLTWPEVFRLGEDVLRGLMDAHRAGIVHRDLKPGNIFLARQPDGSERGMILDFGVCKVDGSDGEKLTVTGESLGTVSYMAPEQIRGASKVDERADLYSFAMVVFEALSGRLAHDATGQMAMLASKLERSARSIREVATVPIPEKLEGILRTCLARKPGDRYPSAQELLKVWSGLAHARTLVQPRASVVAAGSQSQPSFPHVGVSGAVVAPVGATGGLFANGFGTQTSLSASTVESVRAASDGREPAGVSRPRRRTPMFIGAGAIAAGIMVMGAVALGRAPRPDAATDLHGTAELPRITAATTSAPLVSATAPVLADAAPAPTAPTGVTVDAAPAPNVMTLKEIDLETLPLAGGDLGTGIAPRSSPPAAIPASSPVHPGHRPSSSTSTKKPTKDGFMSEAPF